MMMPDPNYKVMSTDGPNGADWCRLDTAQWLLDKAIDERDEAISLIPCGECELIEEVAAWLIAEARYEASRYRDLAAWMADDDPDHPMPSEFRPVLLWEGQS